ncbi:MAG: SET domain-containing protein-lysine N-methyltransferase [Candidatus Omnitrophica bacterium]|nr:SET domain-containing protein-lysine N-methyltransferase [Candidatus Omnitrophota bacterium]MBU1997135.1 SET domain-containing protein-lysine N-methyltransferase [Candidatus Omnitrophota bacterium]MBU4334646.1 SET domain-containing protein-lysine N-methyltransferase [Candidatus Omnitrophota bacterium]
MIKTKSPYIVVKQSSIHNKGVFARKDIPEGARIIEYVGEKITKKESERRADIPIQKSKKSIKHGAVYLFELNKKHDIDGNVAYNTARFINHTCEPNCETLLIRGHIWIVSITNIKKGAELSYNYGYSFDDYERHKCYCNKVSCVGYILNEIHWHKVQHKKRKSKNSTK